MHLFAVDLCGCGRNIRNTALSLCYRYGNLSASICESTHKLTTNFAAAQLQSPAKLASNNKQFGKTRQQQGGNYYWRKMTEKMEISANAPLADYQKLIKAHVMVEEGLSDDLIQENFKKISAAAHATIWKLLFGEPGDPLPENRAKAAALLEACKADASFHSPWLYNEWIVELRDELLKREMLDFWRDIVVKRELGPCSVRDCDLFDSEDSLPIEFYERGGCKAPFTKSRDTTLNFEAVISDETPVEDYKRQMKAQMHSDDLICDEVREANSEKIFDAVRAKIWTFLFEVQPPSAEKQALAGDLLYEYKTDACFYAPWPYNEWIGSVRDELLKRNMNEFWRDQMVKRELGPCWAKDSDYFDDMTDPEPEAFYKHAGCEAPFQRRTQEEEDAMIAEIEMQSTLCERVVPIRITLEKPLLDYIAKFQFQMDLDPENKAKLEEIFGQAREVVWELLFKEPTLSVDNFQKAGDLLETYKHDACFYSPHEYNDWIVKLRDELFKRQYFDFWDKIVVGNQCGLCWYKDSEHFDDRDDTRPIEFYKSAEALRK